MRPDKPIADSVDYFNKSGGPDRRFDRMKEKP